MSFFRVSFFFLLLCLGPIVLGQDSWTTDCGDNDAVINQIMINACGTENTSEYLVFQNGTSPLDLNVAGQLDLNVPENTGMGGPVDMWMSDPATVANLNLLMGGCAPDVFVDAMAAPTNGIIPAGAVVWTFFTTSPDISYINSGDLSDFCGSSPVYVIFGDHGGTIPIFINDNGCGSAPCIRTIVINIGGCMYTIVYDPTDFLPAQDGDYLSEGPGVPVYHSPDDDMTDYNCIPEPSFCSTPPDPIIPSDSLEICEGDVAFPTVVCGNCTSTTEWYDQSGSGVPVYTGTSFPPDITSFPAAGNTSMFFVANTNEICVSAFDTVFLTTHESPPPASRFQLICVASPCEVCQDDSIQLNIRYLPPPPAISGLIATISDGTNTFDFPITLGNNFVTLGPISSTITYTLTEIQNQHCSVTGFPVNSVTVNVVPPPNAGSDSTLSVCNAGASVLDLVAALDVHDGGGNWTDVDGSGVSLSNPSLVDFSGIGQGTYHFDYIVVTACPDTARITVDVLNPPTASDTTLQRCESFPAFILSNADAGVTNSMSGLTVTYHLNMSDASSGSNPLPNLYVNTSDPQVIFARVEDGLGCHGVSQVTLEVEPGPTIQLDSNVCASDLETTTLYISTNGDSVVVSGGYTVNDLTGGHFEIMDIDTGVFFSIEIFITSSGCSGIWNYTPFTCPCATNPPMGSDTTICLGGSGPKSDSDHRGRRSSDLV